MTPRPGRRNRMTCAAASTEHWTQAWMGWCDAMGAAMGARHTPVCPNFGSCEALVLSEALNDWGERMVVQQPAQFR